MTATRWIDAGGPYQVPFMIAAGQALKGMGPACPKCAAPHLQHYFHVFDRRTQAGTVWVWCRTCHTHTHLPRVHAKAPQPVDPFAGLDLDVFAALELDGAVPFLDRIDRLAPRD
jgi:hypothetical protein